MIAFRGEGFRTQPMITQFNNTQIIGMENQLHYKQLISNIGKLLASGRARAAQQVNSILVQTYWEIGRYTVEYERQGKEKAEYSTQLFEKLSRDLTQTYGKGFGRANLVYIRKLYLIYPICGTLSHQLTWSHYYEILKADSELEIGFYAKQCEKEKWSVRELKRQMKCMLLGLLAQYQLYLPDKAQLQYSLHELLEV